MMEVGPGKPESCLSAQHSGALDAPAAASLQLEAEASYRSAAAPTADDKKRQ